MLADVGIVRQRLSQQIAEQLQELIVNGALQPGDKLPSELQLAAQVGVSRTVIREAVQTLEQKGLLKVLVGSGTYVSRVAPQVVSESIGLFVRQGDSSFSDLDDLRQMFEIEVVGLAAERAKPEDILRIEEIVQEMATAIAKIESQPEYLEQFVEADLAFHNALAEATQNPLFSILLEPITHLLMEFRRLASKAPGAPADAFEYHRRVLEQVKAGNALASREIMREHLTKAREWIAIAQGDQNNSSKTT